jgi:hypothetical protein
MLYTENKAKTDMSSGLKALKLPINISHGEFLSSAATVTLAVGTTLSLAQIKAALTNPVPCQSRGIGEIVVFRT